MSSPACPRTCGTRVRVTDELRGASFAERRGTPGIARRSVVCALAEHDAGPHHGILVELADPHGDAVWASWTGREAPRCSVLPVCDQHGPDPRTLCDAFSGHPGACSFDQQDAFRQDPERAERIDAALAVLATCDHHRAEHVAAAAHDAVLLTWDELRARLIWTALPECDHAAVYRLVSRVDAARWKAARIATPLARHAAEVGLLWAPGSSGRLPHGERAETLLNALEHLPDAWQAVVLGGQREPQQVERSWYFDSESPTAPARPSLDDAVHHAAQQARAGQDPPPAADDWSGEWDCKENRARGQVISERLAKLPYGWRVDTVRSIAQGTPAMSAVGDAQTAINIIRSYGVHLAWNARCRPRATGQGDNR
ncbi:hypothetical protein [Streptomyces sp. NPDC046988]|uniref:hypothetical protein n=1 Tax=Streptomyces sp. NPDC046988 TaxID=3154922 RepID=UPI00340505F3